MKLHLPTGLRAALLAVFSLVTTGYTASADQHYTLNPDYKYEFNPDAASYGYTVDKQSSPIITINNTTFVPVTTDHGVNMSESWVLSVAGIFGAQNALEKVGDTKVSIYSGGCVIAGNVEVPFYENDILKDKVRKPKGIQKNQFAVYYSPDCNIYVVTSSGVRKICETGNTAGSRYSNPIQITLNWEYNEDTGTGSLYLLGVNKATHTDDAYATGEAISTERITILENVSLTNADLQENNIITTAAGTEFLPSEVYCTKYSSKITSDAEKIWLVTGIADIEELKSDKNNAYCSAYYDFAHIQLTGSDAGLYLTDAKKSTDGTYEYKLEREYLRIDNNILHGDMGTALRFGADAGCKFTIDGYSLGYANVLSGNSLHIFGKGTVRLELDVSKANGANANSGAPREDVSRIIIGSMAAGSTLEFKSVFEDSDRTNDESFVDIAKAYIGAGASIIRAADSNQNKLTLDLLPKNGYDQYYANGQAFVMGTIANDNGDLNIKGGEEKKGSKGQIISNFTSSLTADTLRATNGSITLSGGVYKVKNIEAASSPSYSLSVGQNYYGAINGLNTNLYIEDTLTANSSVLVYGTAHLGKANAPSISFTYNSDPNNKLSADSINATSVTLDLVDAEHPQKDSKKADIPTIPANVTIASTSGSQEEIINSGFAASVIGENAIVTAGSIKNSDISITEGTYVDSRYTNILDPSTLVETEHHSIQSTVLATKAEDINFSYIKATYNKESGAYENAAVQVLTNAGGTNLSLSSKGISAGTLDAESIVLPTNQYSLIAGKVTADTLTLPESSFTGNVKLENVVLTGNEIAATSISATDMELGAGSSISNSVAGTLLQFSAEKTIVIREGSTVSNAEISTGEGLTVNNDTLLDNTTLQGVVKTNGTVTFKSAGIGGSGSTFGGANGDAFIVDSAMAGIESIDMDAVLSDGELSMSHLTIYGEGLAFTEQGESYNVLTPQTGSVDYEPKTGNNSIYIQPWVRAKVVNLDDSIKLTGARDEEGIKDELRTSENRSITIDAIDELKDILSGNVSMAAAEEKSAFQTIHDYLGHVHRYTQDQREKVLDAVSGASLAALADSQRRGIADVQSNLRNRVIQMGGGTNDGYNTEWAYNGLQAWAQADGGLASVSGGNNTPGYDFNTTGATVGANLDVTNNLVMGVSFSVSYGEITSDNTDHAKGNNDAQYFSFFARHQSSRWVQMLILTAGKNEMDLERNVLGYSAKGDTKGSSLSAYYELGYTMGLDYEYTHIIQPLVSIRYTSAEIDKFSESGTLDDLSLDYNDQSLSYGTVAIGARYQGVVYTSVHERNAVAEARVLVSQDFGDKTDEAEVAFADGTKHKVKGADTTGVGLEIGGGLSIPVQQHTTLYADADVTFNGDYNAFRANIGLRYDF